jgi:hypothetical protein
MASFILTLDKLSSCAICLFKNLQMLIFILLADVIDALFYYILFYSIFIYL